MKLPSMFLVFLGLQVCQPALAGSMFRCEIDGKVEFSDRQCQPVKRQADCQEKDGKVLPQESPQKRCATAASGESSARPARLALNELSSSAESQLHSADSGSAGADSQHVGDHLPAAT